MTIAVGTIVAEADNFVVRVAEEGFAVIARTGGTPRGSFKSIYKAIDFCDTLAGRRPTNWNAL